MNLAPIGSHLLAVLAAGIEIRYLVRAENIVHVLGKLCLKRRHDGKFLAYENLGQQLLSTRKDHRLLVEVLDKCTLGQEFRHITYLMTCFLGQTLAGARKNGRTDEYRDVR